MSKPNSYVYRSHGPRWVKAGVTAWPRGDSQAMYEVEHRLRYGGATPGDLLVAADVMASWRALVSRPAKEREAIMRAVRFADHIALRAGDGGGTASGGG